MTPTDTPTPRGRRRRARRRRAAGRIRIAVGGVVGVAVLVAGVGYVAIRAGWLASDGADGVPLQTRDDPQPEWSAAPAVFDATGPTDAPSGAPIADVLAEPLAANALGGRIGMVVVDLASSETVFGQSADVPQMPASTTKVLTTTAALSALGPDHRFRTAVMAEGPLADGVTLTLVGGGDPMLGTDDAATTTSLPDLAAATAEALITANVRQVGLAYDETLFTGPAVDPEWEPDYVAIDVVAPTSALTVDGGRTDPDAADRTTDPAAHAADDFAALLTDAGITVEQPAAAPTSPNAAEIAAIESMPLSSVVEHTLDTSDNDAAEVLMRHVALARGLPATSADGSTAVLAELTDLGLDVSTVTLADGSGLARGSEISTAVLGDTLAVAASAEHPELRAAVTGLPVAGFTGTLEDRWDDAPGAGAVRAKTGTLTGTSALAGVVETTANDTLAFAIVADDVTDTVAARAALDDVAGALSTCGCTMP